MVAEGELLWEPDDERVAAAATTRFARWLAEHRGVHTDGYDELWRWSVADLDGFWSAAVEWFGVRWKDRPTAALADRAMPGARWFPGGTLNYAEHLLHPPCGVGADDLAVVFAREDGVTQNLTWRELREQVASARAALVDLGVGLGDRVAALLPNCPAALVAMLATASLGAIWSSCSPDFGARAVADRFTQIEPAVLFTVDGYVYGGKRYEIGGTVEQLLGELPSVRGTVLVPYLDEAATMDGARRWPDVLARPATLDFEYVAFDTPMWVLFSSGTTGLPKPILHGQGGILVEHLKQLTLHLDLGPGDRFFWFSTTGWMMWNLLVSGLAAGAAVVLFDGNPMHPVPDALWQLAQRVGITSFGVSAPYLQACERAGVRPADLDLRHCGRSGPPGPRCRPRASPGSTRRRRPTCCCPRCLEAPTCVRLSSAPRPPCPCAPASSRAGCSVAPSRPGHRTAPRWWVRWASW